MIFVGEKMMCLATLGMMVISGHEIMASDIWVLMACIIVVRETLLDKVTFSVIFQSELYVSYKRIQV